MLVVWQFLIITFSIGQPLNAINPMVVTELGIATDVIPLQPSKVLLPMVITVFGMVILFRPLQP